MKQKLVQIMLRLEPEHAQSLADAAHAARLPVAVFARELVLNRIPKTAPPLISDLSFEAAELLKICNSFSSNLSQLDGHAARLGEPVSRLNGPAGILFKLGSKARQIGLMVKAGQMDPITTSELLARLEGPARALNEDLARPLNEGYAPSMEAWRSTLEALQSALEEGR